MRNIWVPRNDRNHDLSNADKIGKVCEVYGKRIPPYDFGRQRHLFLRDVLPIADESDFIMPLGPSVLSVHFVVLWTEMVGKPKFLLFNRETKEYFSAEF